jgi:phosphoglycerate dehydrogenase-like enzyme
MVTSAEASRVNSSATPTRPRIALAMRPERTPDLMGSAQWQRLRAIADVLDDAPMQRFDDARAAKLLAGAQVLLTGWGCPRLDADMLGHAPHLRLVAHAASSVKTIVSDALWVRGIDVVTAAAANAVPVAEFALAAILFANKGVFKVREQYKAERAPSRYPWIAPNEPGNLGATVGIVGASRTGRHLLRLLQAFELRVLVYDPLARAEDIAALGASLSSLDEVVATADVLSIHVPLLPQTRHMINAQMLARMKDGATLINTARGEVVEPEALERALVSGRLSAVLDVTTPEPLSAPSPLFDLPNVFVTPHMAGAAGHETRRMADLAIDEVERFALGLPLEHRVTEAMLGWIG